jgi:hypothetical protein
LHAKLSTLAKYKNPDELHAEEIAKLKEQEEAQRKALEAKYKAELEELKKLPQHRQEALGGEENNWEKRCGDHPFSVADD